MTNLLSLLVEVLPHSGEWRFPGQREKWLEAAAALVDMEMDNRQTQWRRQTEAGTQDIGPCGAVIVGNGNGGER